MKSSVLAALSCVLLLALLDSASARYHKPNHREFGRRTGHDGLMLKENVRVKGVNGDYQKERRRFDIDHQFKITAVKALDQKTNGNGGYVYVADGGVGKDYVYLDFISQQDHGIDFDVEIYGEYIY